MKVVIFYLKDHPASALGLEVAVHLPGSLGQVAGVDEVHPWLGGALGRLDVVAR